MLENMETGPKKKKRDYDPFLWRTWSPTWCKQQEVMKTRVNFYFIHGNELEVFQLGFVLQVKVGML